MGPYYETAQDPHLLRQHETGLVTDLGRHARMPENHRPDTESLPMLVVLLALLGIGFLVGAPASTPPDPVEIAKAADYSSRP